MRTGRAKANLGGWSVVVLAAAVVWCPCVSAVRADRASAALAKFKRPVEQSVDRALMFLAKHQLAGAAAERINRAYRSRRGFVDITGAFESRMQGNTGISGLCVMAFLAVGHTPGHGPYGQIINRGIDYLIRTQQDNGLLTNKSMGGSHGPMYAHCIATLTLAEVSGMVDKKRQKRIDATLPKALEAILKAQRVRKDARNKGGWRYKIDSRDSDMSLTGWAIMALRAGRLNGAAVPKEAIKAAVEYILRCRAGGRGRGDGSFGYQVGQGGKDTMTGAAILCLSLCGEHENKALIPAGEWLYKRINHSRSGSHYYYGVYYCSQAMFQLGGKYWEKWAARMYTFMLKDQAIDGSWTKHSGYGPCYGTAMGVLAMTVSYRQLPIYQR